MGGSRRSLPAPAAAPLLLSPRELREGGSACRGRVPVPQFPSPFGGFWGCTPSTPISHIFWGPQVLSLTCSSPQGQGLWEQRW